MSTNDFKKYQSWVNRTVACNLSNNKWPQIGTVRSMRYSKNIIFAEVAFENSEKEGFLRNVKDSLRLDRKPNAIEFIPVSYISLLIDESVVSDRTNARQNNKSTHSDTQSICINGNLYTPCISKSLFLNESVVWFGGGEKPETGVLKWIGTKGVGPNLPLKAWVEFNSTVFVNERSNDCTAFDCKDGRGRFVLVRELMLRSDYTNFENNQSEEMTDNCSITGSASEETDDLVKFGMSLVEGIEKPSNKTGKQSSMSLNSTSGGIIPLDSTVMKLDEENEPVSGIVKWIGSPFQNGQLFVGIDFERPINIRNLNIPFSFPHKDRCGALISLTELQTSSHYKVFESPEETEFKIPDFDFTCEDNDDDGSLSRPIEVQKLFSFEGPKGIQGRNNSCYIDATIFSMFAFTNIFDEILQPINNPPGATSTLQNEQIIYREKCRRILRNGIVLPLRRNLFVPFTNIAQLRKILATVNSKLTSAFMDVEELMFILFENVFELQEFISYDTGSKDFIHSITFPSPDSAVSQANEWTTVNSLLELSLASSGIKFNEIPSPALILQMPVCNGQLMTGKYIIPNLQLKINVAGSHAQNKSDYDVTMDLIAVICIKFNHFVSFVKCGEGLLSHWVFFDSNPVGENPQIEIIPEMAEVLIKLQSNLLKNKNPEDALKGKMHEQYIKRLLSDVYTCIYTPPKPITGGHGNPSHDL